MILSFISQNAAAWRCFTFSKHPVTLTSEGTPQSGHVTPASSPSVMNHVMHASYGEVSCQKSPFQSLNVCFLLELFVVLLYKLLRQIFFQFDTFSVILPEQPNWHDLITSYSFVLQNPESFMVWVHFKAPQKFTSSTGGQTCLNITKLMYCV